MIAPVIPTESEIQLLRLLNNGVAQEKVSCPYAGCASSFWRPLGSSSLCGSAGHEVPTTEGSDHADKEMFFSLGIHSKEVSITYLREYTRRHGS